MKKKKITTKQKENLSHILGILYLLSCSCSCLLLYIYIVSKIYLVYINLLQIYVEIQMSKVDHTDVTLNHLTSPTRQPNCENRIVFCLSYSLSLSHSLALWLSRSLSLSAYSVIHLETPVIDVRNSCVWTSQFFVNIFCLFICFVNFRAKRHTEGLFIFYCIKVALFMLLLYFLHIAIWCTFYEFAHKYSNWIVCTTQAQIQLVNNLREKKHTLHTTLSSSL